MRATAGRRWSSGAHEGVTIFSRVLGSSLPRGVWMRLSVNVTDGALRVTSDSARARRPPAAARLVATALLEARHRRARGARRPVHHDSPAAQLARARARERPRRCDDRRPARAACGRRPQLQLHGGRGHLVGAPSERTGGRLNADRHPWRQLRPRPAGGVPLRAEQHVGARGRHPVHQLVERPDQLHAERRRLERGHRRRVRGARAAGDLWPWHDLRALLDADAALDRAADRRRRVHARAHLGGGARCGHRSPLPLRQREVPRRS